MRIARSLAAVVAGYGFMVCTVVVGTIVGTALFIPGGLAAGMSGPPPASLPAAYLAANLAFSLIGAVIGGWLAARIGRTAPLAHAAVLAAVVAALSLVTMTQAPAGPQPAWYASVVAILGVAGVLAGGALRASAQAWDAAKQGTPTR